MAADTARTLREAVTGIQADFPGVRVSQHVSMRVMAYHPRRASPPEV
jgi:hypothetical protein